MAHQVLKLLQQKPRQCSAIKTVEFIQQIFTTGNLRPTWITIRFDSKFQLIAHLIKNEKKTVFAQH